MTDQDEELAITYSLSRSDLLYMRLSHFFSPIWSWLFVGCIAVISGLISVFASDMESHSLGFKIIYFILINALVFGFVVVGQGVYLLLATTFQKLPGFLGEHTIEITKDGIVERTAYNETLHKWIAINRIKLTPRFLYIYVSKTSFHVIPRRYFSSEEWLGIFCHAIEKRMSHSQK